MPYPDGARGGYRCHLCDFDTVARVLLDDHIRKAHPTEETT